MKNDPQPPAWNIESEYASIASPDFASDMSFVEANIPILNDFGDGLDALEPKDSLKELTRMIHLREACETLGQNLATYVEALLGTDVTRMDAKAMQSKISELNSRLSQSGKALDQFLMTVDTDIFQHLLLDPSLAPFKFTWIQNRARQNQLLSKEEETLLEAFTVNGHTAWMNLYYSLVGTMKCTLQIESHEKTIGLSEAMSYTYASDEPNRKSAWLAVQEAWRLYQVPAAAILNALAGWRIEVSKKRSRTKPINFLTQALFDSRVEEATLNALMDCCRANLSQIKRAPRVLARVAGKTQLDPWDLTASCPALSKGSKAAQHSYKAGFDLVLKAFKETNPELANFAAMMDANSWIEARVLSTKSTGGYCTEFPKSREPRIFVTYQGSSSDITTLAHELGHAYHAWVMKDLHRAEAQCPSTLAETASVFAEQILRDHLSQHSENLTEKIEAGWSEMQSIQAYLIDIPSRFEFEKQFHELRIQQTLTPEELCALMDKVRADWYGDTISATDSLFWASKLHFSSSGSGFYNFQYAFGYLFAMSLYARRKEQGPSFNSTYIEILRDTGRMTAEALIQKHLGEDIRQPQFWQKSVDLALKKVDDFEKLIQT